MGSIGRNICRTAFGAVLAGSASVDASMRIARALCEFAVVTNRDHRIRGFAALAGLHLMSGRAACMTEQPG
jgi:hypothetical protein